MTDEDDNPLGRFLRDRRAKLDPAAFGFPPSRRRTPGLRREEVAQRANVSATWYTWLEQGRGGAPSAAVLERLAGALMLGQAEREHLFLLALGRPPEIRVQPREGVSRRLQRVLDSLADSPALVYTAAWDVMAWNEAAAAALSDYGLLAPSQRNIVRIVFGDPRMQAKQLDWEKVARFVIASFRADAVRAGMPPEARALVEEMRRGNPVFEAMWLDHDVRYQGEGTKVIRHAEVGLVAFEYSAFAVDGEPDLRMVIYTPAGAEDEARVRQLVRLRRQDLKAARKPARVAVREA